MNANEDKLNVLRKDRATRLARPDEYPEMTADELRAELRRRDRIELVDGVAARNALLRQIDDLKKELAETTEELTVLQRFLLLENNGLLRIRRSLKEHERAKQQEAELDQARQKKRREP